MSENKNDIRAGEEVTLSNGDDTRTYTIYPASLRQLRKLNKIMGSMDMASETMDDTMIDSMVEAASIILSKVDKDLSEDLELIEDMVDVSSFNKMFGASMGTDPNE